MNAKEKLKNAANSLVGAFDWIGGHLTGLLTISLGVLAFLYSAERKKKQLLETDLTLKDQTDKITVTKQEVESAKQKTKTSGDAYDDAKRDYDASKRKPS